jgi:hypothetical protein
MHVMPHLVLTLLLSATLAVPAATAQTNADSDWEGTWRCEAVDGAGAFTSPAVATISGSRIKLSRAGDASDVVLNGTIDAGGAVTLTGRGPGPDGRPVLSTFNGTLSGRSLTASGRAVPLSGGVVQTCALALAQIGAPAGPTVLRGSGGPVTDAPYPAPEAYPPAYDYPPTVIWYDNDFFWRRHRLARFEHARRARDAALRRQQRDAIGPTPPNPPQVVTPPQRPTSLGGIAVPPPQPAPAAPPSPPSRPTSLGGIAVPPPPPPPPPAVQSAPPPQPMGTGCRPGRSIGGRC